MSGKKQTGGKSAENVLPLRPALPCPECGKQSVREHYPFCSSRCRALDLNRWLSGSYVLPGRRRDEEQDD